MAILELEFLHLFIFTAGPAKNKKNLNLGQFKAPSKEIPLLIRAPKNCTSKCTSLQELKMCVRTWKEFMLNEKKCT